MHTLTFNRLMSIILIFIVAFFAVYVPPMETVHAFAITASVLIGAAALLTASGVYALNADAINQASTALCNYIYETGSDLWNFFEDGCRVGTLVMNYALTNVCDTFKDRLFDGTAPGNINTVNVSDWSEFAWSSNGVYNSSFHNTYFDLTTSGLTWTSGYAELHYGFGFMNDEYFYCYREAFSSGKVFTYKNSSGVVSTISGIFADTITKIYWNNDLNDWFLESGGVAIALGIVSAYSQLYGMNAWKGLVNSRGFIPPSQYVFDDVDLPHDPFSGTANVGKVINPGSVNTPEGAIPVTSPEQYVGKTANDIDVIGTLNSPTEDYVRNDLPLYSIAALSSAGVAFTNTKALQDTYFVSKSLINYYNLVAEAQKVVDSQPTIASWKYYPNGIPPEPPPDKPPKWNPFKLPTEPPWKACKEIMITMAWHVIQLIRNKFFTGSTGDEVPVNSDIVGISENGDIVYQNNDNTKNNVTAYPYYEFDGHVFNVNFDINGNTLIFKDGLIIGDVITSGEGLYEGFIVVGAGMDTALLYVSQVDSTTTDEFECHRITDGILDVYDTTGSTAIVTDLPSVAPAEVVIAPSIDEQLELGQADTITSPDDDTYEYITAIQEQTGSITASLSRWFTKLIDGVKSGFDNIGNRINPPTTVTTDFEDPDPDVPGNKGNPLTLFFVFWKLLLACIGLLTRFGVFVASLVTIPATGEYINEYILQGLEFGRNQSVFGLFTIWGAFQGVFGALYCFFVVKIVKQNYGRL